MTQNPASPPLSRSAYRPAPAVGGDDLDALLDSIMGDDPGPPQPQPDPVPVREAPRQRPVQPRVDESRARQVAQVTDDLRHQIRALALQVQSLNDASATQAAQGRAIQELRQAVREILVATHKQKDRTVPAFNAELQLPALQIKLVLAQAANLLHQADKDVAVLGAWSMLFGGITLGMLLSIGFSITGPYTTHFWIYLSVAIFALLVSLDFAFLTHQARRRVANARRAMDESTLTRTVPVGNQ